MNPETQRKAQQRVDRIVAFKAELNQLQVEGGLELTPAQRAQLDTHLDRVLGALAKDFGADVTESARQMSWGMRVATLLGGAALFTALVLFLHRIWGMLPAAVGVMVLTAIPLGLLLAAESAARREVNRYYVAVLSMAAGVAFVMGLTAGGAIYNTAPSPHALLAWAVFALLLAYAHGLRLILGAGLVLCCAYVAALGMLSTGGYWDAFFDRAGFLLVPAGVIYALPALRGFGDRFDFAFVYRLCGGATALLTLWTLSKRGDLCCSGLPPRTVEALYQLMGLVGSALIVAHGLRLSRGGLVNLGTAGFLVFLFVRLHAWWWNWMPKYLFFLLLGLIAMGLLLVFRRLRSKLAERRAP